MHPSIHVLSASDFVQLRLNVLNNIKEAGSGMVLFCETACQGSGIRILPCMFVEPGTSRSPQGSGNALCFGRTGGCIRRALPAPLRIQPNRELLEFAGLAAKYSPVVLLVARYIGGPQTSSRCHPDLYASVRGVPLRGCRPRHRYGAGIGPCPCTGHRARPSPLWKPLGGDGRAAP